MEPMSQAILPIAWFSYTTIIFKQLVNTKVSLSLSLH